MAVHAVITAGGTVDGALASRMATSVKALAPLGERTLLDVALDACGDAGIERVAVIGGDAVRAHLARRDTGVRVVDAAADGGENVLRALDAWPGERIVYLTSDLPFATGAALHDLLARSAAFDLAMGVASTAAYDARFPGAPPYGVALGGERLVNACAFAVAPAAVPRVRDFATRFFAARKSLARMALLLGPVLCLRFALKRLTVGDVEAHASRRLGLRAAAIRDTDPGLCYDVDTLSDYEYALEHARRGLEAASTTAETAR